ncbi:hypothetical protein B0I35DRAFT_482298 [Stachybotrys elegans]|uniref:2EXR domain-containing protein n=1 Tax=Stachybotrys elegans TaxID=80388 RepID=A0A8K0SJR0_9HYPO|nr:hypothetical protein B0I35DRAFT_482298 [Stachybotrys elegans]
MASFHPFKRLPLELRQRIWDLGIEPRRIHLGELPSPAHPLLHVCAESRSYLQHHYVKVTINKPPHYAWINLDVDIICLSDHQLVYPTFDIGPMKRLSVSTKDAEWFWWHIPDLLVDMQSLEDLEIRPSPASVAPDADWWREWDSLMEMWYYADSPVQFHTRIVSPYSGHQVPEIRPDNYLKVERDARRRQLLDVSDSEDDVDAPHRFRAGWRHAPGCKCPSQRSA